MNEHLSAAKRGACPKASNLFIFVLVMHFCDRYDYGGDYYDDDVVGTDLLQLSWAVQQKKYKRNKVPKVLTYSSL